jgi:uncharacterized repeat protein (TIGR03803 family)
MGSLVEKDGKLYGLTSAGGANNVGVLFEFDLEARQLKKLADFAE